MRGTENELETTERLEPGVRVRRSDLQSQNTALRKAQRQLEESRNRYEDLYDLAPVGYISLDEKGAIVEINMTAASMLDTPVKDAVGRLLLLSIFPQDSALYLRFLRRCRAKVGALIKTEVTIQTRNGFTFPAELVGRAGEAIGGAYRVRLSLLDVIDRRRAEEERVRTTREQARRFEAERANRLKDEFLAKLSHDLRTPLNAILTWTVLLREGHLNEALTEKALETIERNTRTQVQLIEDLLDVSRIIAGKLVLDPARVDLGALVQHAIEDVEVTAREKGIEVVVDRPADPLPDIVADPSRLQQVLYNLLLNSIKFSPASSTVKVVLAREAERAVISVIDEGKGIAPELLPYIFEPFRQGEHTTHLKSGGLGLGLAIVNQIVEMHGGDIRVSSEGEGRGATFKVSIPLRTGLTIADDKPEHVLAGQHDLEAKRNRAKEAGSCAADDSLRGITVLVVEDEDDARDWLTTAIHRWGADVMAASSASEALEALERARPDVLVSDIGLPGRDGYWLIKRIRSRNEERLRDVPAVALTAFARSNEKQRALEAGFQRHIAKPFEPEQLKSAITNLVRR